MQEKSSAEPGAGALAKDLSKASLAAMVGINAWPLLHVSGVVALAVWLPGAWTVRLTVSLAALYLLPPLAARPFLRACRTAGKGAPVGSRAFFSWWITIQLQMIFNRLPFLEELLRLVPGLYSLWLRLWGARIGARTFWASGIAILDRPFLKVGDGVVFGAGVRINPHVLAAPEKGAAAELLLADVVIGDGCSVGGYSLLTAGTELAPGETTRAFLISPPFSHWRDGKRIRGSKEEVPYRG